MNPMISEWVRWMRAEGKAHSTVRDRTETMRMFESRGLDIAAAGADEIVEFLAGARELWQPSTLSNRYRCLKAWYLFLVRRGHRPDNPMDLIKPPRAPKCVPRPISNSELQATIAAANRVRTLAMVLLGAYQGLRVHEIAKMRGELIRGGELRVLGKGGSDKQMPLHPEIATIAARFPARGLWFPSYSHPGRAIHPQAVTTVVGRCMQRAGVDATAHQLRHWFGTEILEGCGNMRTTQELMRHESVASTQIYTRVGVDKLRLAILSLPTWSAAATDVEVDLAS